MRRGIGYFLKEMDTWVSHGIIFLALGLMLHDSLFFDIDKRSLMLIMICEWSVLSLLFSYCVSYNRARITLFATTLLTIVGMIGLIGFKSFLPMTLKLQLNLYLDSAKEFFQWSYGYLTGIASKTKAIEDLVLMVVLYWFICGALFILSKNKIKTRYYLLGIIYFVIQWNQFIESASSLLKLYLIGLLIHHLVQLHGQRMECVAQPKAQNGSALLYSVLVSVCLMSVTTLFIGMVPIDQINDALSDKIPDLINLRDSYENRLEDRVFDFANTLYSPQDNRLGGTIDLRKDLIFKVSSSYPGVKLRGTVKSYYTGDRWISRGNSKVAFESASSVDGLERIRILPMDFKSSTLMTPLNAKKIDLQSGKAMTDDQGVLYYKEGFFNSELKDYDVYYDVDNYELLGVEARQEYLQVPDGYSQGVKQLTTSITINEESENEKALAIEAYLRTHYEYSLEVDDYGKQDFVESFLLEGKKGYCTYFASSMVIMARLSGIPARYVEGYYLPTEKEKLDLYRITADRAHAWPELYIEGRGWVTYEPTPAYNPPQFQASENANPILIDNEETGKPNEEIEEVFVGNQQDQKRPYGLLIGSIVFIVLVFYIVHLRKQNRIQGTTVQEKETHRIYRMFNLADKVDQHCNTLMRPDQKMMYLLSKIVSNDLNDNDIIDAVNQTLFSPWGAEEVHIESLLCFEEAVHTYVKKRMNGIVYVYYKISGLIH